MPQRRLVSGDAIDVGGKDEVKLLGGRQEGLEMYRIFLVPEHCRYLPFLAPLQYRTQFVAQGADLAIPELILTAPGGFDEQQIGTESLQFPNGVPRRQRKQIAFRLITMEREFVHDTGHLDGPEGETGAVPAAQPCQPFFTQPDIRPEIPFPKLVRQSPVEVECRQIITPRKFIGCAAHHGLLLYRRHPLPSACN